MTLPCDTPLNEQVSVYVCTQHNIQLTPLQQYDGALLPPQACAYNRALPSAPTPQPIGALPATSQSKMRGCYHMLHDGCDKCASDSEDSDHEAEREWRRLKKRVRAQRREWRRMEKYAAARRAWEEAEEITMQLLKRMDARIAARRAHAGCDAKRLPSTMRERQASAH